MVVDTDAFVAFLAGEPGADEVEALMRDPLQPLRLSAANLSTVVERLRVAGHDPEDVVRTMNSLFDQGLEIVDADRLVASLGGWLRAICPDDHGEPRLSLDQCLTVAASIRVLDGVATADPDLADCARGWKRDVHDLGTRLSAV